MIYSTFHSFVLYHLLSAALRFMTNPHPKNNISFASPSGGNLTQTKAIYWRCIDRKWPVCNPNNKSHLPQAHHHLYLVWSVTLISLMWQFCNLKCVFLPYCVVILFPLYVLSFRKDRFKGCRCSVEGANIIVHVLETKAWVVFLMRVVCISINVCNKKLHSHSESKCNSFHRFNSTLKIKFLFLLPKCTDVHIINSSSCLLFVHDENRVHWTHLLIYVLKWGKRKYNSGLFLCVLLCRPIRNVSVS